MSDELTRREKAELYIDLWKKTVDVQQHFNDLELRIRSIAVALVGVVMGAAAVALREGNPWVAAAILFAGLVCWLAFYLMDAVWYHKLLRGAVQHGMDLEDAIRAELPGYPIRGLTAEIGAWSAVEFDPERWYQRLLVWLFVTPKLGKDKKLHTDGKMLAYYQLFGWMLLGAFVISLMVGGWSVWKGTAADGGEAERVLLVGSDSLPLVVRTPDTRVPVPDTVYVVDTVYVSPDSLPGG